MDEIKKLVYSYKTKYKEGFINDEMQDILKQFPDINMEKFNNAMQGNTCIAKGNQTIIFHCDVEKAIRCGVENRDLKIWEWD